MKKCLTYIDPVQSGKVLAALYFGLSLIFVPFFLLMMYVASSIPSSEGHPNPLQAITGIGVVGVIILPVFYTIIGFITGAVVALIYNAVAKFTGGLELTFEDVAPALPMQMPAYPPQR